MPGNQWVLHPENQGSPHAVREHGGRAIGTGADADRHTGRRFCGARLGYREVGGCAARRCYRGIGGGRRVALLDYRAIGSGRRARVLRIRSAGCAAGHRGIGALAVRRAYRVVDSGRHGTDGRVHTRAAAADLAEGIDFSVRIFHFGGDWETRPNGGCFLQEDLPHAGISVNLFCSSKFLKKELKP